MDLSMPPVPPAIMRVATQADLKPLAFADRAHSLVFRDEFNANGNPDPQWARTYFWGGRTLPTNREEQIYTDAAFLNAKQVNLSDNASIDGGYFRIGSRHSGKF